VPSLDDFERRHAVRLPAPYHRLHADGMLDGGPFGGSWLTDVLPVLRERPPLLLYALDLEMVRPDEIDAASFAPAGVA
jgi:hypothetical protein